MNAMNAVRAPAVVQVKSPAGTGAVKPIQAWPFHICARRVRVISGSVWISAVYMPRPAHTSLVA